MPLPVVLAEVDGLNGQQATEFAQLVQWLAQLPAGDLARVRDACRHALAPAESGDARHRRIALIGLRGAGNRRWDVHWRQPRTCHSSNSTM
ncbi:hypothetical protein ACTMU2_30685 [Cupriavidus basilensis]